MKPTGLDKALNFLFTHWKTTGMGFLAALAMVLAETNTDVAHVTKYQLAKAASVFFLGFFAKDGDKSGAPGVDPRR